MNPVAPFENYPFEVKPLSTDGSRGYVIRFPDLPGCMAVGHTVAEVIANAREAFQAWIESAIADGLQVPDPNGVAEPVKFVQRLPKSLHAQLLRAAASDGTSLNTFVTLLVAEGLSRRERPQPRIITKRTRNTKTTKRPHNRATPTTSRAGIHQ
jgi:antitoxin HicB